MSAEIQELYVVFKPNHGFATYHPDKGSITHTQDFAGGSEATKDSWSDVLGMDLVDYTFIPSGILINRLQRAFNSSQDKNSKLRETLEKLQFSELHTYDMKLHCVECGLTQVQGHHKNCALKKLLAEE